MWTKKLYLNKNIWPFYLFWICFFPPQLLEAIIPYSKIIFYSLQFVFFTFIAIVMIISCKTIYLSFYELSLICLSVYGGIVCLLFSRDMIGSYAVNYIWPIVSVSIGIRFLCINNKSMLIDSFRKYFVFLLYLNTFSMVLFPHGIIMSSYGASIQRAFWLLGSKNIVSKTLPLFFLAIMLLFINNKMLGSVTMIICILVVASMGSGGVELLSGSTTALVMSATYFALMLLLIFSNKYILKFLSIFSPVNIAILTGLLSYLIYLISQGKIKIVNTFLVLLGKDYTFSYRNTVWKAMVSCIKENFGVGIGFQELSLPLANIYTNQCYSFWGTLFVRMGIVGIVLWIIVFFFSYRNCELTYCVRSICIALFMLMIYGLTNDFSWKYLIVLLSLIRVFGFSARDDSNNINLPVYE